MAQQTIGVGSSANDGTGDPLRTGGTKINANFTELYQGIGSGVTSQTGTSYTAALTDAGGFVRFTNASAVSFTIPPNSSVAFPIGTTIRFAQIGAGTVTAVAGAGVTINAKGGTLALSGQYAVGTLKKTLTDTWVLDQGSGSAAAGGSAWNLQAGPLQNEAPSSNFATLSTRNLHPILQFDDTTAESAVWTFVLPNDYAGAGVTVTIYWTATSATTGNVMWQASFEAMSGQDIDSDGFATAQAFAASACNGTSGIPTKVSLNVSDGANMDSVAAGTQFRLKITRDASNASDTMTGDAEILRVMVVSQ